MATYMKHTIEAPRQVRLEMYDTFVVFLQTPGILEDRLNTVFIQPQTKDDAMSLAKVLRIAARRLEAIGQEMM